MGDQQDETLEESVPARFDETYIVDEGRGWPRVFWGFHVSCSFEVGFIQMTMAGQVNDELSHVIPFTGCCYPYFHPGVMRDSVRLMEESLKFLKTFP